MAKRPAGRTYTVEHVTGARCTFDSIEAAAAMTGWEGWTATDVTDLPAGVDLTGVPSKAALLDYAAAMMVDTSAVTTRTTRAELEELITAPPTQQEG